MHAALVPNNVTQRKLFLATSPPMKLKTMPTPHVPAQTGVWSNFLANTVQYLPFPQSINRNTTSQLRSVPLSVVLVADQVLWFGNDLHCSLFSPRAYGYGVCDDPWAQHPPNWHWFEISFRSTERFRTESFIQVTCPNWLGNVELSRYWDHFVHLDSRGHTPARTAFKSNACCQLYINRWMGYMVPINSTLDGDLPHFWPALRVFFICEYYPRARCTYGDARWDKRNVHERTTLKCNIWESKS